MSSNGRAFDVVVAERDGAVRDVVAEVLEGKGARTRRVANTEELILALRGSSCDALVVESDLWRLGGSRLREALGSLERSPAVVLTGEWPGTSQPPTDVRLLEKPFSAGALVAAVCAALSARATPAG